MSICATYMAMAQTFTTKAPSSAAQNEPFRVEYVINTSNAGSLHCPNSTDFTILGGPSTSTFSSTQWVNGKSTSTSSVTYTYILQATRTGKLNLPRPTVKVGGKSVQATAASINITAASATSNTGGKQAQKSPKSKDDDDLNEIRSAQPITAEDVFVRCSATKTSVSEQEPTLVTYKLYARNGIGVQNVVPQRKPDMQGFWTQEIELPQNLSADYTTIKGVPYRIYTFMQFLVFPMQSGSLKIPAVDVDITVVQRPRSIDALDAYFNGGGIYAENIKRRSGEILLDVKPLPTPKPANYCGAVGKLKANAELLTKEPASNDVITYRITVSGQGNMKLIQAPKVSAPTSFEAYDPKMDEDTKTSEEGISGSVAFDYTFVPREEGDFEIPATEFGYFDTETRAYKTITIPAVPLHVKKGTRSREDVEREVAFRNGKTRPDHTESSTPCTISWLGYLCALALIVVLAILAEWLMHTDLWSRISQKWARGGHSRNKRFVAAEAAMQTGDAQKFYSEISKILDTMPEHAEQASEILSRRYAPDAAEREVMTEVLDKVAALKRLVVIAVLAFSGITTFAETAATNVPTLPLSEADSAYNAGNAAFRKEDYATATLSYARALWMDPSHDDARYNLAVTQARLEDQFAQPQEMFFTTWMRNLYSTRSAATWYLWSIALFALLVVCAMGFRHSQGLQRRLSFYALLLSAIGTLITGTFGAVQEYSHNHNTQAVVTSDEAPCYVSALERSSVEITLHPGTLVEVTAERGDIWREISLPDGRKVWTKSEYLQSVSK